MKYHILVILLLGSLTVFAQEDAPRPDIEELLKVMRIEKLTADSLVQVKGMMARMTMTMSGTSAGAGNVSEKVQEMQGKTFDLVGREMSWEKMKPGYIKMYAEIYTPDEIKQLIALYKTPAGQLLLDKEPLVMQKTMAMTQKKMADIMPQILELAKQDAASLSKDAPKGDAVYPSNHRRIAERVLEDLRLIDSATDQYTIETDRMSSFKPTFTDLKNYLKPGTTLYSTGADPLGTPYGPFTVDSIPKVSDTTFNALSDVADESFWSPYK